jgi:hypothetical protein
MRIGSPSCSHYTPFLRDTAKFLGNEGLFVRIQAPRNNLSMVNEHLSLYDNKWEISGYKRYAMLFPGHHLAGTSAIYGGVEQWTCKLY